MKNSRLFLSIFILFFCVACSTNEPYPSITLSVTNATIKPSEYLIIETVVTGSTSTIVWTSSDENVATVESGYVQPKSVGVATITASVDNVSATCIVTVALGEYQLVWEDDFDGTDLNTNNWNIEIGNGSNGWGNGEAQYYTSRSENIRVQNSNLEIELRKEDYEGFEYTSARITTENKKDFKYGKIEARIKLPSGGGTWPAFWMLGYGSWPYCGEIDIMEHVGNIPTRITNALHCSEKNGGRGNNYSWVYRGDGNFEGVYRVYGIEWEESIKNGRDMIKFTVDGEESAILYDPVQYEDKAKWPFFDNFFIILNLAIGGTMGGSIDNTIFSNGNPIIMYVDWVKVYQRL